MGQSQQTAAGGVPSFARRGLRLDQLMSNRLLGCSMVFVRHLLFMSFLCLVLFCSWLVFQTSAKKTCCLSLQELTGHLQTIFGFNLCSVHFSIRSQGKGCLQSQGEGSFQGKGQGDTCPWPRRTKDLGQAEVTKKKWRCGLESEIWD